MKKYFSFAASFLLLILSGCSNKASNSYYYGSKTPNYGSMNNSQQAHKATMRHYQINDK